MANSKKQSPVNRSAPKGKSLSILLLGIVLNVQSASAASGMFPKMPPATNASVVDTRKDSENARMTAWALQGLINQKSAEVYVLSRPFDLEQLEKSGKPFERLKPLTGDNDGLRTLFQKYQGQVKKMFIYDPDKDWTWYLALMSGAQQEGIPVTESIKDELISAFGWKGEIVDLRNQWANRVEAYNWALEYLMARCSRQVVFALSRDMPLIDYVVASKGFVFWLNFNTEQAEIKKIFATRGYGAGTSLMGYANNGDEANSIANPYGIGYVVSDFYSNGSFWSSFPDKTYTQSPGTAITTEPGKVYVHIIWSDGDNIQFDQNPLYKLWQDPARGTIPVGTELAPALQELNTPLLDWYYSKLTTNDELVAGPTGCQFIFIRDYNESLFPAWCNLTRIWCAGAGFHATRIWIAPKPSLKYSEYMTMCGFDGLFGEGWEIKAGFPPKVDTYGANNEEDLFNEITNIKPDPQKPVFAGVTCIVQGFYKGDLQGYSTIRRVLDRVEAAYPGRYAFLLPKDEFATIRAYYNSNVQQVIGLPGRDHGLTPIYQDDGQFKMVQRDGKQYWLVTKSTSSHYFYIKVPDEFRPEPGKTLEIDLSYLDEGSGDIGLDYDSTDIRATLGGAYKRYPYSVHRMNSGQWKLAQFYVSDAGFGGSENNFADFRFDNGGDDLLIRAVEVRRGTF